MPKIMISTFVNAGRNANGVMVGARLGRDKYKVDSLEWPYLTASQWSWILKQVEKFYIDVTFPDPVNNTRRTVRMYIGDRSCDVPNVVNGMPTYYLNCKFNVMDVG
jgi:hypothetical protein